MYVYVYTSTHPSNGSQEHHVHQVQVRQFLNDTKRKVSQQIIQKSQTLSPKNIQKGILLTEMTKPK